MKDIKIKKIEAKKELTEVSREIKYTENENVCSIEDAYFSNWTNILKLLQNKFAYISFGFMSFGIAMYIFFVTSIVVLAVQERSYIFNAKKIETEKTTIQKDFAEVKTEESSLSLLKTEKSKITYIKRIENINAGLSLK